MRTIYGVYHLFRRRCFISNWEAGFVTGCETDLFDSENVRDLSLTRAAKTGPSHGQLVHYFVMEMDDNHLWRSHCCGKEEQMRLIPDRG